MGYKAINKEYNLGDKVKLGKRTGRIVSVELSMFSFSQFMAEIKYDDGETNWFRIEHLEELEEETRLKDIEDKEKEYRYYNKHVGWGEELNV